MNVKYFQETDRKLRIIFVMEFSDWITARYLEWRGQRVGNSASVANFAKLFDASQPVMSNWMRKGGDKPRKPKYVTALVRRYGPEVYDFIELPRPPSPLEGLPDAIRLPIEAAVTESKRALTARELTGDEPEAEELIISIFAKHGVKATMILDAPAPASK